MQIIKAPIAAKAYYIWEKFISKKQNILIVENSEIKVKELKEQLKFLFGNNDHNKYVLFLPKIDSIPYDRISPSNEIILNRVKVFGLLCSNNSPRILITSAENLVHKLPPITNFESSELELISPQKINIGKVVEYLANNGYNRVAVATDSAEFAVRGEIIDIIIKNSYGIRINFAFDQIESINKYDPYTQVTTAKIDQIALRPAIEVILSNTNIEIFKQNFLKKFGVNHIKNSLYQAIISGNKIQGCEQLMPLMYNNLTNLFDYFNPDILIYDSMLHQIINNYAEDYKDLYQARLNANKTEEYERHYLALPPDCFLIDQQEIDSYLKKDYVNLYEHGNSNIASEIESIRLLAKRDKITNVRKLVEIIKDHEDKIIIIFAHLPSIAEKIIHLLKANEINTITNTNLENCQKGIINIAPYKLDGSFAGEKYLFLSDADILDDARKAPNKLSSKKKLQNILTELDNITENELVVHQDNGIGRFIRIETIKTAGKPHDFLKLLYDNNDIFYLPVENINQIKKYGSNDAPLDRLGNANWQKRKSKVKGKIKDIAKKLLKITAARALVKIPPTIYPKDLYNKFVQKFPYVETSDQLNAIRDIEDDLSSGKLMDRLVCGDVGFGKTEVAMRAAFITAINISEDRPQVAIIVPTTILCKQHYKNFLQRFTGFNLNIKQLSRLITTTEAKKIKNALAEGEIDIIIGTHALISRDIKFKNLQLVIVDEEQHFGVSQKERLKEIKHSVHVLSMSATPIPRTLQMSMVGIKDLSLITTPPIDRLAVKTTVIPEDVVIIKEALMREKMRGGVSFYVVPRIKDIANITKLLDKHLPELKYEIAHGQMPASQIDKVMSAFGDGDFDLLISTTIIESGIDIASANTMIAYKSDMLGLSQLYQLRGRVGRGKIRGYCYLTTPRNKKVQGHSLQRLEILRNINSLGAGFTIASHDMDLRGFGNLVGDEQSGHVKEVGSELYQQMLDEQINNLKNKKKSLQEQFTPIVNIPISVLIPEDYIDDSSLRLAIYRRAANLQNESEIEEFCSEMIDRFGEMPVEFKNLLEIVRIRHKCYDLKIQRIDTGAGGFVLTFNDNFDVADMVLSFTKKYPRKSKVKENSKLVFVTVINNHNALSEIYSLLGEL